MTAFLHVLFSCTESVLEICILFYFCDFCLFSNINLSREKTEDSSSFYNCTCQTGLPLEALKTLSCQSVAKKKFLSLRSDWQTFHTLWSTCYTVYSHQEPLKALLDHLAFIMTWAPKLSTCF